MTGMKASFLTSATDQFGRPSFLGVAPSLQIDKEPNLKQIMSPNVLTYVCAEVVLRYEGRSETKVRNFATIIYW